MLYPKPTVYWVYVEDESNGCVAQFLQLINFNQITFQKNSVSLLPTQQVGSDLLFVSERMSNSNNKESQSKRKQRKSEVASTEGAEDQFSRLASAIGTPTKDMQTTIEQEQQGNKPYDDQNEESSDFEKNNDFENGDDLDAAIEELMEMEDSGSISLEDVECLMDYIDRKLTEKVSREDLARRMRSPAQRRFCVRSMKKQKKQQADNMAEEGFLKSADLEARTSSENAKSPAISNLTKNSLFQSPEKPSIADSTFSNSSSFTEWSQFEDEHLHLIFPWIQMIEKSGELQWLWKSS